MDTAAPPIVISEPAGEQDVVLDPTAPSPGAHGIELGVGSFLQSGIATSGVVGVSPFLNDRIGRDVFVRFALNVGRAPDSPIQMTWVTGRLDTCAATVGNYAAGSGLRLDLCAGADFGATFMTTVVVGSGSTLSQTLPYIDLGPSVAIRAELGAHAALTFRAAVGINVARETFIDATGASDQPPIASTRLEIDLSWTLPGGQSPRAVAMARSQTR
jgi:hypothetical protein